MSRYKFWNTKYMRQEHINAIKRDRRIFIKEKIVDYGGNFLERVSYDNGVWVNPVDDPIINELESLEIGENGEYDFNSLTTGFKRYMREKDNLFFNIMFKKFKNAERYGTMRIDDLVEKAEGQKGAALTDEEFMDLMMGNYVGAKKTAFKQAKESAMRAYDKVIEYGRCNADRFKYFCTLTFAPEENKDKHLENGLDFEYVDRKDFEEVKKAWTKFRQAFARAVKRDLGEFEFLTTYERHKDGAYHFHMLCTDIPERFLKPTNDYLDIDFRTKQKRNGTSIGHWKFGKSDVELIRDKEAITTYISKYIVKSFYNADEDYLMEFKGYQKYWVSKGLNKAEKRYYEDGDIRFEKEIKKIASYSDKYETKYKNVYDGYNITKTVYSRKQEQEQ